MNGVQNLKQLFKRIKQMADTMSYLLVTYGITISDEIARRIFIYNEEINPIVVSTYFSL